MGVLPTRSATFMEKSCPLQYIGQICKYYPEALTLATATVAVDLIHFWKTGITVNKNIKNVENKG